MKILFIISSLGLGGAERVLSTLANHLSLNHEVLILKLDNEEPFYKISNDVTIESLDLEKSNNSILKKIVHNFTLLSSIRKSIKKYDSDIIISFMDRTNINTLLATRFLGKKLIISERTNFDAQKNKILRKLRNITYPYTDGMVVLSQYDYNKYYNVKNKKIIFNPLFVNADIDSMITKEKVIISVGRIIESKAFDILLNALVKIDSKLLQDWKVYIIGDGRERQKLESMVVDFDLVNTVEFLGVKKNVVNYYKKASIFISTSRSEGFPNTLSEALSLGCASIATDCISGPSELIKNEDNGFLVEVDNIDQIKDKLELLMKDKTLRDTFSRRSIEMSKKYKIDNIVKEWEEYINEII
ncbi:MAG: glycosyltransferase family 4 protein [Epsilonproteobacteria bacterium]|nr:MAG: glycosyltransferase family 4 protein [Campylobacterota bacterium]